MRKVLRPFFDKHVGGTYDKQLHLAELIGDRPWELDLDRGVMRFGDDIEWRAQLLGTESELTETWLWSWANEASRLPPEMVRGASALRAFGERTGVPEFAEPELPLERGQLDGHTLAVIATGALKANAYYRGPYEGGAAFILIADPAYPLPPQEDPIQRICTRFPEIISRFDCNHRRALKYYLRYYGLEPQMEGPTMTVPGPNGPALIAAFDELERLTGLKGSFGG